MTNQQQQQIKIRAKDEQLKGVYSNLMQILHTKEEFILDFFSRFTAGRNFSLPGDYESRPFKKTD